MQNFTPLYEEEEKKDVLDVLGLPKVAPAPAPAPKLPSFDPAADEAESDRIRSKKAFLAGLGGVADSLSNIQGWGNFYLGKMNPGSNVAGRTLGAIADGIEDPAAKRRKMAEAYLRDRELAKAQDEDKRTQLAKDPASRGSMAARAFWSSRGFQVSPEDSEADLVARFGKSSDFTMAEAKNKMDLDRQIEIAKIAAGGRVNDRYDRRMEKLEDRQYQENKDREKSERERETTFGIARTPDDAKKLKEAAEVKSSFDAKLSELIKLRETYGAEVANREVVGRAKQLSKELLLAKKNLESLGVLSKSDEDIINAIIPSDPTQFNMSQLWGQDPTLNNLKKLKGDTERDFNERLKQRILTPSTQPQAPQGAFPRQVRRVNENGVTEVGTVSNEKELQEAISEGFQ